MKEHLGHLRVNYNKFELNEEDLNKDPFALFKEWFDIAHQDDEILEPNAMTLATVGNDLQPKIRIVLLKEYSKSGFTFFSNYNSSKGSDINQNPKASLLFFWESLHRQIRINGLVEKISRKETEDYFNSRPYESRLGAIASTQSEVLENRESLQKRFEDLRSMYPEDPPCPEHWGGYILIPNYFEFWQGRESRLHDRITYSIDNGGNWNIKRLYP